MLYYLLNIFFFATQTHANRTAKDLSGSFEVSLFIIHYSLPVSNPPHAPQISLLSPSTQKKHFSPLTPPTHAPLGKITSLNPILTTNYYGFYDSTIIIICCRTNHPTKNHKRSSLLGCLWIGIFVPGSIYPAIAHRLAPFQIDLELAALLFQNAHGHLLWFRKMFSADGCPPGYRTPPFPPTQPTRLRMMLPLARRMKGLFQDIFLPRGFIRPIFHFHNDRAGFQHTNSMPLVDGNIQSHDRSARREFDGLRAVALELVVELLHQPAAKADDGFG